MVLQESQSKLWAGPTKESSIWSAFAGQYKMRVGAASDMSHGHNSSDLKTMANICNATPSTILDVYNELATKCHQCLAQNSFCTSGAAGPPLPASAAGADATLVEHYPAALYPQQNLEVHKTNGSMLTTLALEQETP